MKKIYCLILIAAGLIGMSSCTQDDYENLDEANNQKLESKSMLRFDSVPTSSIITPLEVNPDRMKRRTSTRTSYDSYLSDNFWAIRELSTSIQSSDGRYLTTTGLSLPIILEGRKDWLANQQFYFKVLPATSGIPYLIYSGTDRTPLAVGQRSDAPDNKVLFTLPNESSLYSAAWDIYRSTNNPGRLVVESQSYMGQGDSGDWMDIFYYVWETKGDNPIGYGKYQQKSTQEFIITPLATFTLENIKYVDEYSAVITKRNSHSITVSYKNTAYSVAKHNMIFAETVREPSSFIENKGINFTISGLDKTFRRPSAIQGNIDLNPSENEKSDALYSASQNISNELSATLPLNIPPRTKMEVTYYFNTYDIEANYEATIKSGDRETKLGGVWKGTIHVDEKVDPLIKNTNLDTGEVQSLKVNIENVSKSNPVTF